MFEGPAWPVRTAAGGPVQVGERINPLTTALQPESASRPRKAPGLNLVSTPDALNVILESLADAKAEEITSIDITGKSPLGDHMVVASGRSHRHVGAIADRLINDLRDAGLGTPRVEGLPHCDWVLVDAGDVIVHVFRPEVRSFYNLEKMWQAASLSGPTMV
jgi:ribosome-associated protein